MRRNDFLRDAICHNILFALFIVLVVLSLSISVTFNMDAEALFADSDICDDTIDVVILMYHNIVADNIAPSKYEITVSGLSQDMKYLKEKGYQSINTKDLIDYTKGKKNLPKKCVMLTFDDGYYSYMKYIPPLLEEFDMKAVISVVGDYTRLNKNNPNVSKRYTYLDFDDIGELSKAKGVEIALHSYDFHNITKSRKGAMRAKGESEETYKEVLTDDTTRLIESLKNVGVKCVTYAYPYGAYSSSSDRILNSLGIECTLTCNEGVNRVKVGDNLNLLMRYNRDGSWDSVERIGYFKQR